MERTKSSLLSSSICQVEGVDFKASAGEREGSGRARQQHHAHAPTHPVARRERQEEKESYICGVGQLIWSERKEERFAEHRRKHNLNDTTLTSLYVY